MADYGTFSTFRPDSAPLAGSIWPVSTLLISKIGAGMPYLARLAPEFYGGVALS